MRLLQSFGRVLAFVGKELVEVARRPGAVVSLILGPLLIMVLFGLGYDPTQLDLRAVLVVPPESGLPTDTESYKDIQASGGRLVAVVQDPAAADAALSDGSADVAIYAPADLQANLEAGKQSTIRMDYDLINPVRAQYAVLLAERIADRVNQTMIQKAVTKAKTDAGPAGSGIKPDVIAAPTRAEARNLAPITPDIVTFYGPAILALLVQHAAVTLAALSMVRERRTGIFDLFRVSAASAVEIIVGKTIAFAAFGGLLAALVAALLAGPLHVPLLGDPALVALAVGVLLAASLGVGMFISVISDSERQAVQLSLILLLGSVFLSGLVLDLHLFLPVVQAVGALLPVTHGITLLQGLYLRGQLPPLGQLYALIAIAVITFALAWLLLRRGMAARTA